MTQVVDLDQLVGGNLVFKYQGKEYAIPGDLSTLKVFELFQAFQEFSEAQLSDDPEKLADNAEAVTRASDTINAQLLSLFQILQPDLETLPFGVKTMPVVIREVLKLLGVAVEEGTGDDGGPPAPAGKTKKTSSRKTTVAKRSPRSRGSRSS